MAFYYKNKTLRKACKQASNYKHILIVFEKFTLEGTYYRMIIAYTTFYCKNKTLKKACKQANNCKHSLPLRNSQ